MIYCIDIAHTQTGSNFITHHYVELPMGADLSAEANKVLNAECPESMELGQRQYVLAIRPMGAYEKLMTHNIADRIGTLSMVVEGGGGF
jgi:hypothetical protein